MESRKRVWAVILSSVRLITMVKLVLMWSDRDFFCLFRGSECEESDEFYYPRADVITPAKDGSLAGTTWGI